MGEALSYNSLGLYLGIALGPPLGELLLERGGFEAAWYGGALLALVGRRPGVRPARTRRAPNPATGTAG